MDKKKQIEVLKYYLGRIYRSDRHKSQLDARIRGIKAKRRIEGYSAGEDPASIRYWISEIEDRIIEQKREIDLAIAQVMDILEYLPINSIERQICELRHIDFKPWGVISTEIPMSRSQVYRRYKMALDTLLANQRVQAVMKEYEGEYDKYIHGWPKRESGGTAIENLSEKKQEVKAGILVLKPGFIKAVGRQDLPAISAAFSIRIMAFYLLIHENIGFHIGQQI